MEKQQILTISWAGVFKIIMAVVFLYIFYLVKDILVWFVFALILGILFNYFIDALEKKRIPRLASAAVLYAGIFALLSFFIYQTAPLLLKEVREFAQDLPSYLKRLSPLFEKVGLEALANKDTFLFTLQNSLNSASDSMVNALFSIFGGATSTILVLAMAFFISLEKNFVEKVLLFFSPKRYQDYLFRLWRRAKQKVSGWFITRVIGVLFVGSASYLVLRLLGVEYAFVLAVIAGLFDLVPIIGPTVAGLLIFAIVALNSLPQAIFVAVAFIITQLLENNVLFPILFKRFVGMSPVLVLVALAVGAKIWGAAGAVLAIPLAGVVFEVLKDYLVKLRKAREEHVPITSL